MWGGLASSQSFFLAAQDGADSAEGHHSQILVVLVLIDHVNDAAEGGPGILIDGGPQVRVGGLLSAGSSLHDH